MGVFQKQQTCARHTKMFWRHSLFRATTLFPVITLFERGLSGCKKLLARLNHKNRTMLIPRSNVLYYSAVYISGSAVAKSFRLQPSCCVRSFDHSVRRILKLRLKFHPYNFWSEFWFKLDGLKVHTAHNSLNAMR